MPIVVTLDFKDQKALVVLDRGEKKPEKFNPLIIIAHQLFHVLLSIESPNYAEQLTNRKSKNPDYSNDNEIFAINCENQLRAQFGMLPRYGHHNYETLQEKHRA